MISELRLLITFTSIFQTVQQNNLMTNKIISLNKMLISFMVL